MGPKWDQKEKKTWDLTGIVYPAIAIGVDLTQDTAQQVICIFESW